MNDMSSPIVEANKAVRDHWGSLKFASCCNAFLHKYVSYENGAFFGHPEWWKEMFVAEGVRVHSVLLDRDVETLPIQHLPLKEGSRLYIHLDGSDGALRVDYNSNGSRILCVEKHSARGSTATLSGITDFGYELLDL